MAIIGALILASCSASGSTTGDRGGGEPGATDASGSTGRSGASAGDDPSTAIAGLTETERSHLVEEGDTTWDVTYSHGTTLVAGDALASLIDSDRSAGSFTFDTAAAAAAGVDLAEGRVLLIAGQALGRITAVGEGGGETTVETEPASLADVIEEGTVAWDVPIRFDFDHFLTDSGGEVQGLRSDGTPGLVPASSTAEPQLTQISMLHPDGRVVPIRTSDDDDDAIDPSIEIDREAGSVAWTYGSHGNKYQFRLTSKGDSVDILVVVSRGGDDPTMAFRGEGTIGNLRSASSSSYSGGELTASDIQLRELSSDLDLSVAVAGAGISPVDFELPLPMLTFTWLVGPIPVTLDISAEIIGKVDATINASATAEASFSYRGDAGFKFEGGSVSASGATDIGEMDPEPADSAAPMGIDVDAQFGLAFPKVSLSILGQGLIPSLHTGAVVGSRLEWGDPAAGFAASSICKSAYVRMEVTAGYELSILGRKFAEEEYPLFEDEKRASNDGCPEEDG